MQKGDLTIAFKTIALSNELSDGCKRVAAALLDHYNRETGRCDPSQETLAEILGIASRTVARATKALEKAGYFRTVRHGGKFLCNQYTPIWLRFRQADAAWDRRRRERRARFERSEMSPTSRQFRHAAGGNAVTQTNPENHSQETCRIGSPEKSIYAGDRTPSSSPQVKTGSRNRSSHTSDRPSVRPTSARDAMCEVAHRRWDNELLQRLRMHPALYGRIVELIDTEMAEAATDAELQRRNAGIEYVVRAIVVRDPTLASALDAVLGGRQ